MRLRSRASSIGVSNERGTVAITVALAFAALMGVAAFGVDLGAIASAKRKAQGAADMAAMLAAADPAQADALARRSLADNGYAAGTIAVSPGRYVANGQVAMSQRFTPGSSPLNAVRVKLKTSVRTSFTQVLGLPARYDIAATGTAASVQLAAFTIGSGLAALDDGIANAVLGAMLGTKLSLSAMDYNALLAGKLDGYRFLSALGTQLKLASFDEIVSANARVDQVLGAMKQAGGAEFGTAATAAVDNILGSAPSGDRFRVGDLVDLGDAGALGPSTGARGPSIGAMDTISAVAALANGDRLVSVDLGARIPGLLGTKLTLGIGERRQSSGWVQPNTPNATVKTAQTRLLIETSLAAPLGLGTLNLPVYAEAAYARATLRSTTCPWSQPSQRQVQIEAQPGVLDLAVANVPRSNIDPRTAQPDLSREANLLSLPLVSITGKARATLASPAPQTLAFSDDDITTRRGQRVSSNGLSQSLTKSLIDSISLSLNGLGVTPALRPALAATLSAATPALDTVLDNTLRTLGIRVGSADVTVDGTRCDHAILVQ